MRSKSKSVEKRSRRSPSRSSQSRRSQSRRRSKSRRSQKSALPLDDLRDKIRRRRQRSSSPGYNNWMRDKRRREDDRVKRIREKRKEDEWKRKSDAFIAKLGGPPEPRGFDEPRCSYVDNGRQCLTQGIPGYDPGVFHEHTNHGAAHHHSPSPEVVLLDEDDPPARSNISQYGLMAEYYENE